MRINSTFSKDSSDCIATLSSLTECIQYLVTIPQPPTDEPDEPPPPNPLRSMTVSVSELREMLCWQDTLISHPLDDLDILLQDYAKEEDTLKAVHESVAGITQTLKSKDDISRPG